MEKLKPHWTARSTNAFVHSISFDFVAQLQKRLEETRTSRTRLAQSLGITPSSVSQLLNAPGNIEIVTAVEYARALGLKVALIAYDDGDSKNERGPIASSVFEQCWKLQGTPLDFFDLANSGPMSCRISLFHDSTASTATEPWKALPIDPQQILTAGLFAANDKTGMPY
jgi:transcriptional regulator with XRE-family HTH domain